MFKCAALVVLIVAVTAQPGPTVPPTYPTKNPTPRPTHQPTKVIDAVTQAPSTAPTPGAHDMCTVKLYNNCFFAGYVGTFSSGHHYTDLHQFVTDAYSDTYISSIKIEGNCAVMLFSSENFQGTSKVYTKDVQCLVQPDGSAGMNDQTQSFKVASVYLDDEDTPIGAGNKWLARDEISSKLVYVTSGRYTGRTGRLIQGTTELKPDQGYPVIVELDDGTSVTTRVKGRKLTFKKHHRTLELDHDVMDNDECHVTLYKNCHYHGDSHEFYPGHYPSVGPYRLNNKVSSIKIEGNCKVRLYDLKHFQGTEKEFSVSQPCLNRINLGDRSSSLTVNSIDFEHFDYPTPYPTAHPTPAPTFHLDLPNCPLKCTYHKKADSKIEVTHNREFMTPWRNFRVHYPGVYQSHHDCWHQIPQGIDEVAVDKDGYKELVSPRHIDVDDQGGCQCRCF